MIVVFQDLDFSHREFPIKNIEKFAFNTTDIASTEYTRAQGPVVVLDRPVVDVLSIVNVERGGLWNQIPTLLARMSAPRKTRSQAHSGDWIKRWCLALFMYTRETSIAGTLTSERWTTFEANVRKGSNLSLSFRAEVLRLDTGERFIP